MAERPILLGVDIGSSSIKGLAVDADGQVLASLRRAHAIDHPQPGWAEMDAEAVWWQGTWAVLRDLAQGLGPRAAQVAGIGLCSIGASVVPVDRHGQCLRPGILYGIDSRASGLIAAIEARYGRESLLGRAGRLPSTQSVGLKLAWLRHAEPEVWARSARVLSPVALVCERLCGVAAIDPHTALAWDPLVDARRLALHARDHPTGLAWDEGAVLDLLGERRPMLPDMAWPGERLGGLAPARAAELGLPAGIAVACGTADVLAEALGAGVSQEGDTMVMYGSTLFVLQRVARFAAHAPLWPSVALAPDQPTLMTGTSNAGSALAWFESAFGVTDGLGSLLDQADAVGPGAAGLLCLPYLNGERAPIFDPLARGLYLGLSGRHTRAHLLRALLEGIAHGFAHLLELAEAAGARPQRLVATGGGLHLPLWLQLMSDVTGRPQEIARLPEGAALGAAGLAAMAAGVFAKDLAGLPSSWTRPVRRIEPRADSRDRHAAMGALYREAYLANAGLMHRLAVWPDAAIA
jgi:xylulokinase